MDRTRKSRGDGFQLEALEARLLLSGETSLLAAGIGGEWGGSGVEVDRAYETVEFGAVEGAGATADGALPVASGGLFEGVSMGSLEIPAGVPPQSTTPFEYLTPLGQALDATLKREGSDLVLVDNARNRVLQKQPILEISSVKIVGSDLDDVLKVNATDADQWYLKVSFSGMGQKTAAGDSFELQVATGASTEFTSTLPGLLNAVTKAYSAGSGTLTVTKVGALRGPTPDEFGFSGVESLNMTGGTLFTYVTPGRADNMTVSKASETSTRISGTSGGTSLPSVVFRDVTGVVLDTALNDPGLLASTPILNALFQSTVDQVTIRGKLTASGLKFFTITTGLGADALFLSGSDYALPVSGGGLGFNGGDGADTVYVEGAISADGGGLVAGSGELSGAGSRLGLTSVEQLRSAPTRPLVIVPGLGASFADDSSLGVWNNRIGLLPEQLVLDPVGGLYVDWLTSFQNAGYRLGSTLFIANWDWRLPLAPVDGAMDGVMNGVTALGITDEKYESGVDYLGYALKEASEIWSQEHGGVRPGLVDLVGYDAGGLVARAYLQSPAYGGVGSGGFALPRIHNFSMVGTPNRGVTGVFNILEDNWVVSLDTGTTGVTLGLSYQRVLAGGRVITPQGDISLVTITSDSTLTGVADPKLFVRQYYRSLRDLLPTFGFIEGQDGGGNPTITGLNQQVDLRNNFLLDLNDGQDLVYEMGQVPAGRDPNRFVPQVQGQFTAYYSTTQATPLTVQRMVGGAGKVATIGQSLLTREVGAQEVWYKDTKAENAGDGWVLRVSAVGQFLVDLRLDGAIRVKNVLRTDIGPTTHAGLLGNTTVLTKILEAASVVAKPDDIKVGAAASIVIRVQREIKNTVLMFLEEPETTGAYAVNKLALLGMVKQGVTLVLNLLGDLLESETGEGSTGASGSTTPSSTLELPDGTIPLFSLPFAPALRVDGIFVEFKGFSINKATKTVTGTVGFGADTIALFPNSQSLRAVGTGVEGTLVFASNEITRYSIKAGLLMIQIKDYISASAKDVTITPMGDELGRALTIGTLAAGIPRLGLKGELFGFEVTTSGQFYATGLGFSASNGVFSQLGIGDMVPVDILGGKIQFAGDANKNGVRDPGEVFELTSFDLELRATLSAEFAKSFPFTPILQVGTQNLDRPGDEMTFVVSVTPDGFVPKEIGPIKLGFSNFKIGPVTLASFVTLGGYQGGVFNPDFGGFLKIESGLEDLKGAAQVALTGDFSPNLGILSVSAEMGVGFSLKNGTILVNDALLTFGFVMTVGKVDGRFTIEVSPPVGRTTYFGKLSVGLLQVKLGNLLTLQARKTTIDFNAKGDESLFSIGGTQNGAVDPSASFDPSGVSDGALYASFGTGAGPLSGWGGAVGNFAISANLQFRLLSGFFIQLQVGNDARFGLPAFLPLELRSVTVQFNADAIRDGELVDPTAFSIIVSGGIKESGSWPIFGQFSGLRINVQKLVEGDEIGAIENLNGFSVGLKNVTIGGVKLSGALALGVVAVDVTPEDGINNPVKSFYFRLGGTFFYSGIGGGVDMVFSQYGPLLATISAGGLVEPITGFVFGFKDAGFTFGGAPLPSIRDPKELLTNPVFFSPTTIDLPEIEKRVRNSILRGSPTWSDSFSLTGTATLTNMYVQGMITGELTIAANVGLTGPDAGLKILGVGNVSALGFPLGSVGMLLDLSNPLVPRFDLAASLPAPNNPIGFLFPANATLLATLDTKGIIELPVIGLGIFFEKLLDHSLARADQLFEPALLRIAEEAEGDREGRLAQILLDLDEDGVVGSAEAARVITSSFLKARVVGDEAGGVPGILLTDFSTLLALSPEAYATRVARGAGLIQELIPLLVREVDRLDAGALISALDELMAQMQVAAIEGLAAGWKTFDPSLRLKGLIQPVIFGMPLGTPSQEVTVFINKDRISLEYEGRLALLILGSQYGTLLNALPAGLDGLNDRTFLGLTMKLPGDFLNVLITNLASKGQGETQSLSQYLVDNLNPLRGWEVAFTSTMTLFGFKLGTVSGIIFGPQPVGEGGAFVPTGLFASRVVNLDPDGDLVPNAEILDRVNTGVNNVIPVNTNAQYQNMMRYGGVAFTGMLYLPEILVDPLGVIEAIDFAPPTLGFDVKHPFANPTSLLDDVERVKAYVEGLVKGLTREREWARLQVFAASPASLIDLGNYLDVSSQGVIHYKDVNLMNEVALARAREIFSAGFVEGYSDLKILGTDFGKSYIRGSIHGVEAEVDIPWLVGLHGRFEFGHRTVRTQEVIYDLLTSPLLREVLGALSISNPTEYFQFLKSEALAGLASFELPIGGMEVTAQSARVGEWLRTNFGVPTAAIQAVNRSLASEVFVGGYSLGFGGPGDSGVKRYGGFVLDTRLQVSGLVEDARFHFEIQLFNFTRGTDAVTYLIPTFEARASVGRLVVPGWSGASTLLSLENYTFLLSKNASGLRFSTTGEVVFFGSTRLGAIGAFEMSDAGLAGALSLTQASGLTTTISGGGYTIFGMMRLEVNTTGKRAVVKVGNGDSTIELPASVSVGGAATGYVRVVVDGEVSLKEGSVQLLSLVGQMDLAIDSGTLLGTLDTRAGFDFGGELPTIAGTVRGVVVVSQDAIAGVVNFGGQPFYESNGVTLGGNLELAINTGGQAITRVLGRDVSLSPRTIRFSGAGFFERRETFGFERLEGDLGLGLSLAGMSVTISGSYKLVVLQTSFIEQAAAAEFLATRNGIAGRVQIGAGRVVSLGSSEWSLRGVFVAEINTTGARVETVLGKRVMIDPGARIYGDALLGLSSTSSGSLSISGLFILTVTNQGLEIAATTRMTAVMGQTTLVDARVVGTLVWRGGRELAGRLAVDDTAFTLNGGPQYLNAQFVPPQTEVTTEFWFQTTDPNAGMFSVADDGGGATDRGIYLLDGNLATTLWLGDRAEFGLSRGVNYADGRWHHVAHVMGASVGGNFIYVDGKLVASGQGTASLFTWGTRTRIGYELQARSGYFQGMIDEVRIWNQALTGNEVLEVMRNPVSKVSTYYDKLVAYYDGSSTDGVVATDRTGRSPSAHLLGGAGVGLRPLFKSRDITLTGAFTLDVNLGVTALTQVGGLALSIPPSTILIKGNGELVHWDVTGGQHRLQGDFSLGLGVEGVGVTLEGSYAYGHGGREWFRQSSTASLIWNRDGLAGRVAVGRGTQVALLGSSVDFAGVVISEINTTGSAVASILGRRVDINPGAKIYADASLGLASVGDVRAKVSGGFTLQGGAGGLEIAATTRLSVTVGGGAVLFGRAEGAIVWDGGVELAGRLSLGDSALSFAGAPQYGNASFAPPQTEFTHELWFQTTDPHAGIFSASDASGAGTDRGIYLSNGNVVTTLWLGDRAEFVSSSGVNYADGKWHHVAHVLGSSVGGNLIYVDGQLVARGSGTASLFNGAIRTRIGVENQAGSGFFRGLMDEIRIWNKAMSASEIGYLMNRSVTKASADYDRLVAYYDAESVSGNVVLDRTGRSFGVVLDGGASVVSRTIVQIGSLTVSGVFWLEFNLGTKRVTQLGGGAVDLPGGTLRLKGDGVLGYSDLLGAKHTLRGQFGLSLDPSGLATTFDGSYTMRYNGQNWFEQSADGSLLLTGQGAAGQLRLARGASVALFGAGLDFQGKFQLEFNTTTEVIGTILGKRVDLRPGWRLNGEAGFSAAVEGVVSARVAGAVTIEASTGGFGINAVARLSVASGTSTLLDGRVEGALFYGGGISLAGTLRFGDSAFEFDAPGEYVDVPLVGPQTEVTHEFWFRTTDPNSGFLSVSDGLGVGTDRGIYLVDGDMATTLWLGDRPEFVRSSGVNYADGLWHHVARVLGASVGGNLIYVDGVLVGQGGGTGSLFTGGVRTRIGYELQARTGNLRGMIDDVRIWSKALSAAEIGEVMRKPITPLTPNYDRLIANYDAEVVSGSLVIDRTGRSPAAALVDGASVGARPIVQYGSSKLTGEFSMRFNLGSVAVDQIAGVRVGIPSGPFASIQGTGQLLLDAGLGGSSLVQGDYLIEVSSKGLIVSVFGDMELKLGEVQVMNFGVGGGFVASVDGFAVALDLTVRGTVNPGLKFLFNGDTGALRAGLSRYVSFDGVDDYVQVPTMSVDYSRGFTAEGWIRWDALQPWSRMLDFGNGPDADNIFLLNYDNSTTLGFHVINRSDAGALTAPGVIRVGEWIHVAATITPGQVGRLYVDGQLVAEGRMPLPTNTTRSSNYLGKSNWPDAAFRGAMDEVRLWNVARSQGEIRSQMGQRISGGAVGLLASYSFDAVSGIVRDGSGGGRVAEFRNGAGPGVGGASSGMSQLGTQGIFDGVDDYVQLPSLSVDFSGGFTAEAWVKWESLQPWSRVIDFGNGPNDHNILLLNWADTTTLGFLVYNPGDSGILSAPGVIRVGEWIHVAATISPSEVGRIYVNGQVVAEGRMPLPTSTTRTSNFVGKSNWPDPTFRGAMDEVRVWNTARSEAELRSMMGQRVGGSAPGLLASYGFDDVGVLIPDGSGADRMAQYRNGAKSAFVVDSSVLGRLGARGIFDGADDFGLAAEPLPLGNQSFSLEFWAKREDANRHELVLGMGLPGMNQALFVGFRGGVFSAGFYLNDLNVNVGTDLGWHHWAVTYDSRTNDRRIYMDGGLIARDTASADFAGVGGMVVGRGVWGEQFQGSLDEVRVWSGVRTQAQVEQYMTRSLRGAQAGLIASWNFDPTIEGVVYDASGNGRTLQMLGGASTGAGAFASFRLEANLTRREWVLGGVKLEAGPYVRVQGTGLLSVGGLELYGNFRFVARSGLISVEAVARLDLKVGGRSLASYDTRGGMQISVDGLVAVLSATQAVGWESLGFTMRGSFEVQVNTTNRAAALAGITLEAGVYARVMASGSITFGSHSLLSLDGSFSISVRPDQIVVHADGGVSFFGARLGAVADFGVFTDGIAGRFALANQVIQTSFMSLSGVMEFQVNNTQRAVFGVGPNTLQVVVTNAHLGLAGFDLTGTVSVGVSGGLLQIEVPSSNPLSVSIFGLRVVSVSGFLRSNGEFSFNGAVAYILGLRELASMEGTLSASINNFGWSVNFSANVYILNQLVKEGWSVPILGGTFTTDPGVGFNWGEVRINTNVRIEATSSGLVVRIAGEAVLFRLFHGSVSGVINTTTREWSVSGQAVADFGYDALAGVHGTMSFQISNGVFFGSFAGSLVLLGQQAPGGFSAQVDGASGYFEAVMLTSVNVPGLISGQGSLRVKAVPTNAGSTAVRVEVIQAQGILFGGLYDVGFNGWYDTVLGAYEFRGFGDMNLGVAGLATLSGRLDFSISSGAFSGSILARISLLNAEVWNQAISVRGFDGRFSISSRAVLSVGPLANLTVDYTLSIGTDRSLAGSLSSTVVLGGISIGVFGGYDTATRSYEIGGFFSVNLGARATIALEGGGRIQIRDGVFTGSISGSLWILDQNVYQLPSIAVSVDFTSRVSLRLSFALGGFTVGGTVEFLLNGSEISVSVDRSDPLVLNVGTMVSIQLLGSISSRDGLALEGSADFAVGIGLPIDFRSRLFVKATGTNFTARIVGGLYQSGFFGTYAIAMVDQEINLRMNPFRINVTMPYFQIPNVPLTALNVTMSLTFEGNIVTAGLSGSLMMFGNSSLVGNLNGWINSRLEFNVWSEQWFSIGDGNLGASGTLWVNAGHSHFSAYVSAWAWGGIWIVGNFVGGSGYFGAAIGADGRFTASVSAGVWVPDLGRAEWRWWPLPNVYFPHSKFIGASMNVNFSFSGGFQVWASQLDGSTLSFTKNLNGSINPGDPAVVQDKDGNFVLVPGDGAPPQVDGFNLDTFDAFDLDGDSILSEDEGWLLIEGGEDVETGEPNEQVSRLIDYGLSDFAPFGNAVLFLDANRNGRLDDDEYSVESDETGDYDFYSLIFGEEFDEQFDVLGALARYDRNGDGQIGRDEGVLRLFGGRDIETDTANSELVELEMSDFGFVSYARATVFMDANLNGVLDSGELTAVTDSDGFYYLQDPTEAYGVLVRYDRDQNGVIDPQEGRLMLVGGTHIETGEAQLGGFELSVVRDFDFTDFAGADVFFDANLNGIADGGELRTITDADGVFYIEDPVWRYGALLRFDSNNDGLLTSGEGHLRVEGGHFIESGLVNTEGFVPEETLGSGFLLVAEGRVYFDANRNDVLDADELWTMTDEDGWYYFEPEGSANREFTEQDLDYLLGVLKAFDANRNGELDADEGKLVIVGGKDVETGASNLLATRVDIVLGFGSTRLADARVFLDLDGDLALDSGEAWTTTDGTGWFDFEPRPMADIEKVLGQLAPFDTNRNSILEPEEGVFRVLGGNDKTTNRVNLGLNLEGMQLRGYTPIDRPELVFFDANRNGLLDSGEVSVRATSSGYYSFAPGEESNQLGPFAVFDQNKNGKLDAKEGVFVVRGGRDPHAQVDNELIIRQLGLGFGNGVSLAANPLSNLKVSMVAWWDVNPDEAELLINRALGIPPHIDMNNVDPLVNLEEATTALGYSTQVTNLLLDASALLEALDPGIDPLAAQVHVSDAIAYEIFQLALARLGVGGLEDLETDEQGLYLGLADAFLLDSRGYDTDGGGSIRGVEAFISLADVAFLRRVVGLASGLAGLEASEGEVAAVSSVIAAKNTRVMQLLGETIDKPLVAFARFKSVTQLQTRPAIEAWMNGEIATETLLERFTGEGLLRELLDAEVSGGNVLPWIQGVENRFATVNSTLTIPFLVDDADTDLAQLNVTLRSDNGDVLDASRAVVQGVGRQRTLVLTTGSVGGVANLSLTVHDGVGERSISFRLDTRLQVQHWRSVSDETTYDTALELAEDHSFVEGRLGGVRVLEVEFSHAIDPETLVPENLYLGATGGDGLPIDLQGVTISTEVSSDGRTARLSFAEALPDQARFLIQITGVRDSEGVELSGDRARGFSNLSGDVNGDGRVDNIDLANVRSLRAPSTVPLVYDRQKRGDVNLDGAIDSTDLGQVLGRRGGDVRGLELPTAVTRLRNTTSAPPEIAFQSLRRETPFEFGPIGLVSFVPASASIQLLSGALFELSMSPFVALDIEELPSPRSVLFSGLNSKI